MAQPTQHISSGGFVFHYDINCRKLFVVLVQNIRGEYWIPKGHLEKGEDQLSAAIREIGEECSIPEEGLDYISLCKISEYTYKEDCETHVKKVFLNIFETKIKYDLRINTRDEDLASVDWYPYETAQDLISFTTEDLEVAKEVILRRHGLLDIEEVKSTLLNEDFVGFLSCFIIYGSSIHRKGKGVPNDTDICIVLKSRQADLEKIADFCYKNFKNPQFTIYYEDELNSSLPFRDTGVGWFAMEFFSQGTAVYGNNIFIKLLEKVSLNDYRRSHLEKVFEYILRIRSTFLSHTVTSEYKLVYLNKYITRLLRGIILFSGFSTYRQIEAMQQLEIYDFCKKCGVLPGDSTVDLTSLQSMYKIFEQANIYALSIRTD